MLVARGVGVGKARDATKAWILFVIDKLLHASNFFGNVLDKPTIINLYHYDVTTQNLLNSH